MIRGIQQDHFGAVAAEDKTHHPLRLLVSGQAALKSFVLVRTYPVPKGGWSSVLVDIHEGGSKGAEHCDGKGKSGQVSSHCILMRCSPTQMAADNGSGERRVTEVRKVLGAAVRLSRSYHFAAMLPSTLNEWMVWKPLTERGNPRDLWDSLEPFFASQGLALFQRDLSGGGTRAQDHPTLRAADPYHQWLPSHILEPMPSRFNTRVSAPRR